MNILINQIGTMMKEAGMPYDVVSLFLLSQIKADDKVSVEIIRSAVKIGDFAELPQTQVMDAQQDMICVYAVEMSSGHIRLLAVLDPFELYFDSVLLAVSPPVNLTEERRSGALRVWSA